MDIILDSETRDRRTSMYSREKRMKAVELYIKYRKSAAAVIRELGYPGKTQGIGIIITKQEDNPVF